MPMRSKQPFLYAAVAKEIGELYFPGARLPAETEWCRRLGVARETLRHTLKRLEEEKKIRRDNSGTYVCSADTLLRASDEEPLTMLVPSPDYMSRCDSSSLFANEHLLRGAMMEAVRQGRRIVTIPVSDTNDPDRINATQLSHLSPGSMVIVSNQQWYRNVLPVLYRLNCRLAVFVCKSDLMAGVPEKIRGCFYLYEYMEKFFRDSVGILAGLGAKKILYFGSDIADSSRMGKVFFESALKENGREGLFYVYSTALSLKERLNLLGKLRSDGGFDALLLEINPYPAGESSHDFYLETGIPEETPLILSVCDLLLQPKIRNHALVGYLPVQELGMEAVKLLPTLEKKNIFHAEYRFERGPDFLNKYYTQKERNESNVLIRKNM